MTPSRRGDDLLASLEVMDALRAPDGDAWSAQQTHESLARYLLEEAHEVIEAIEQPRPLAPGRLPALVDELGDLWFQILFHARLGEEEDPAWSVDDVARAFIDKMHRRNPHVFASDPSAEPERLRDVDRIVAQWHEVKAAEGSPHGLGDGIPASLPALQTAAKAVHRARSRGELAGLLDRARAEATDVTGGEAALALLETVVRAEADDVDPESALRTLLGRVAPASPSRDRD